MISFWTAVSLCVSSAAFISQGKEYLNAENLYVPLANDNDEPTFIMGLCRYTPRRSDVGQVWESQVASIPGALV